MEERNRKVAVAGHISLDITPVFQSSGKQRLFELFQPGKLLKVGKAMMRAGGAVSNTGLGLKRLGADVVLMAEVGDGYFGSALKDMISTHGYETCTSQVPDENTSYTIVLAPEGLDRFFLHDLDCDDTSDCGDVDFEEVEGTSHFRFDYPPIMRRFYLDEGGELVRLFKEVKSMGFTTFLDLVVMDPDSEAAGMDWAKILEWVLPYVDFFVPSIEKPEYMLDRPLYCKWQEKAGGEDVTGTLSLEEDVRPLAARALSIGTRYILLKCRAAGIYLKTVPESVQRKFLSEFTGWSDISYFEDSYVPDCILSGTGAGDTSIAAFIKAMLDDYGLLERIRLVAAAGTSCITTYDTLSGLLSFEELRQKMEAGREEQNIIHP